MKRKAIEEFNSEKLTKVAKADEALFEIAVKKSGARKKVPPPAIQPSTTEDAEQTEEDMTLQSLALKAYGCKNIDLPQPSSIAVGETVMLIQDTDVGFPSQLPALENAILRGPFEVLQIHTSHVLLAAKDQSIKIRACAPHHLLVGYDRYQRFLTPNVGLKFGTYSVGAVLCEVKLGDGTKALVSWAQSRHPDCWVLFRD
ncbi:hypothetical protein HDU76_013977 [Blyttiomyces sp. JEL0837]|nr:hypothetical protein HDU76_013977 [Blyttiomyces sp. JEL0837]